MKTGVYFLVLFLSEWNIDSIFIVDEQFWLKEIEGYCLNIPYYFSHISSCGSHLIDFILIFSANVFFVWFMPLRFNC